MELRNYQKRATKAIYNYFKHNTGNPIVALPTGTGKSLIIAAMIRLAMGFKNQRVIILTHVKELIKQNYDTALEMCGQLDVGIYSAGLNRRDTDNAVIFAGIASIHRHPEDLGTFDLILIDECHLVSDKGNTMYRKYIEWMKQINSRVKVIGFSATPYRLKTGLLTDSGVFTDICFDMTGLKEFNSLIDDGWLSPLIAKVPFEELDVSNVGIRGGEFIPGELQHAVNHTSITERAVAELIQQSGGRQHWLVFASGIEHAESIAAILNKQGIAAATVHSKMSSDERDFNIQSFKDGTLTAIVNNNILTTGFDFPDIDIIGMMRPTMSAGLWVQMLGRGTRIAKDKKDCLVLDFAGNTKRLGPINNVILQKSVKGRRKGKRAAPVKMCEVCRVINNLAAKTCIACGAEFPKTYNIRSKSAGLDVIAKDAKPVTQRLPVDKVTYAKHEKKHGIPSLKVTYRIGLTSFREWVCFEHNGYARQKAIQWWQRRTLWPVPDTVDEALAKSLSLIQPSHIDVNITGKYPEIIGYLFK